MHKDRAQFWGQKLHLKYVEGFSAIKIIER